MADAKAEAATAAEEKEAKDKAEDLSQVSLKTIRGAREQDKEDEKLRSQRRNTSTYTDEDSHLAGDIQLHIYYCLHCASYCFVLDKPLNELPKRKTDGSTVVEEMERIQKRNLAEGEVRKIKREKGTEKQFRLNCTNCGVAVGYRPVPFEQETKYCYVIKGAVGKNPHLLQSALPSSVQPTADGNVRIYFDVELECNESIIALVGKDHVKVKVAASQRDGRANDELMELVAKTLGCKRAQLAFEWGAQSKNKVIIVTAMSGREVAKLLTDACPKVDAAPSNRR